MDINVVSIDLQPQCVTFGENDKADTAYKIMHIISRCVPAKAKANSRATDRQHVKLSFIEQRHTVVVITTPYPSTRPRKRGFSAIHHCENLQVEKPVASVPT